MSNRSAALAVLKGDGIGPEIAEATLQILKAAAPLCGLELKFEEVEIGFNALRQFGSAFPAEAFPALKAADGIVLGPVSHNESVSCLPASEPLRIQADRVHWPLCSSRLSRSSSN